MSLLWNTAVQHQAMPWDHGRDPSGHHPIIHSTKKGGPTGFAGYVDDSEYNDELREGQDDDHDEWDEDLYEETTPEPTAEEEAHMDEHGEYPESHYERHDEAYQKAKEDRRNQENPDYEDPDLMRFSREHGDNHALWSKHGTLGPVDIKSRPVYATQPFVSQTHIDKYRHQPTAPTWHMQQHGPKYKHLADDAPVFVTSNGDLHAIEGHHRVAAALQRGDTHIHGWHYDLDKDPAGVRGRDEDEYGEDD